MDKSLSIIIPLYNEEKRVSIAFLQILEFQKLKVFNNVEYIFVDDGSQDNTLSLIDDFIKVHPEISLRVISYQPNSGKGQAVKIGMLSAKNDLLLMVDVDMSTPLSEIIKFIPNINSGAKVIIGSRRLKTSNLIKKQPWYRLIVGELYGLVARVVSGLSDVIDFGCGFKLFEKNLAHKVFSQVYTKGWVFDVEVLYLVKRFGIKIEQVGVSWCNDENSKVKLIKHFQQIVKEMISFRIRHSANFQNIIKILKNINNKLNQDLNWSWLLAIFLICFFIIIFRRLDMILYPQFWAEDGYFFSQAYNRGFLNVLFDPLAGYLQTASRIVAGIALIFPLKFAPLVFNLSAIFVKIIPILLLFSVRFKKIVPNFWVKVLLALIYLTLSNTAEIYANTTNIQWHLALLAFMVIIAIPINKFLWTFFDYVILGLASLSGPFCIFLLPVALINFFLVKSKDRINVFYNYLILFLLSGLQFLIIIKFALDQRMIQEIRYDLIDFIRLISGQVYLAPIIGESFYARYFIFLKANDWFIIFPVFIFLIMIALLIRAFILGTKELKLFLLFCWLILFSSLIRPMVPVQEGMSQWQIMAYPGRATRYFFLPALSYMVALIFLITNERNLIIKILCYTILVIYFLFLPFTYIYQPWPNFNYVNKIKEFDVLQSGDNYKIQIMPPVYKMNLIKK